jgi:hypothetical protein
MAITKEQARKVRQPVNAGDLALSVTMTGAGSEIKILSIPAEKVSWQSSGTLAGSVEFSIDGVTFFGSVAFAAGVPGSYSTHIVRAIKVTWASGSGKLHLLAK